jgi:hypothetical protein
MTISRRTSRNPANFGCLTWASATWDLTAMHPLRLSATVIARKTGLATLTASAAFVSPGVIVPAGSDSVSITVGPTATSSYFGYRPGNVSSSTLVPSGPPPAPSCG